MTLTSPRIDICYIITNGFAARMVTQTNLLGLLVKEGKSIGLICPDINDENLKRYCKKEGVHLYEFNPASSFWTSQYAEVRKYFLEDIETNVALKEKHIWATRYNISKRPLNLLRPWVAYLGYKLTKMLPFIKKLYKVREEKHLKSFDAEKLINEINPKVLVSTYPANFSEAMLLKAGNDRPNTKTIIHLLSWDNISCKGHFPQLADEYIAWGPIMKNEFIEYYGLSSNRIYTCGVPHFDVHYTTLLNPDYKAYLVEFGLNPKGKYLFFGMSSPRFTPYEIDIVEQLASWINEDVFGSEINLIIRPHPQNVQGGMADLSWLPRLENIKSKRVAIDIPILKESNLPWSMQYSDMIRLSHLLSGAQIVLNSGSTLTIDALCSYKPVILTSFDGHVTLEYWKSARRLKDYPHLKKLLSFNGVKVAYNYNDLKSHILEYLINPELNMKERIEVIHEFCFLCDGKATDRVKNFLLE